MGLFDKLFGKKEEINPNHVYAPMTGEAVAITEVPDPTFAEGMMGNGIAIKPTSGKVIVDGEDLWQEDKTKRIA